MASTIELKQCIDNCLECHRICLETIQYCLNQSSRSSEATHLQLLQNCVSICETSAEFMISNSPLHVHTCFACYEVCRKCAEECEKFSSDLQMAHCAEVCRRCAESCEKMSGRKIAA